MAVIQADGVEQQKLLGEQSAADESEEDKHSSMLRRPRPLFRLASPRLRGAFGERHSDSTNASHVIVGYLSATVLARFVCMSISSALGLRLSLHQPPDQDQVA
ncbi:hypothetical protein SNOG_14344 [Parastagonospora nodorum SN15]|uniref:Uncharacterized protein n=1 Tax=Phaeosphaeria nodorum (strain SN15 / ATCC MYA-4574 / FGSC 10173) TaxID=321614 RepID=Q0U1F4_PHANO|nr:hypothetical protein SNOG_14344 [Parastagonospora nodorum SN15]EAT78215.1 hypothetical protein SNOG_14344 [Parastagonospora nodorum SN15]